MIWTALILAAYLLGAVSFSLLIVRALRGIDIRTVGSGNAGATNVLRIAGVKPALAVLFLDVAKGVAPVLTARALEAPGPIVGAAAVAAVCGHVLPVYYGFHGGKGVATAAGALASLAPQAALIAAGAFALVLTATRYVSLASITAIGLFPVLIYAGSGAGWRPPAPLWLLASATAVALLVVIMHRSNIRRLISGREHRVGDRKESE
ncbi:MAG: glycerol-3-phosphate 1-O-acyltransferase PlsY [Thermoanaerobaculia bacterium]